MRKQSKSVFRAALLVIGSILLACLALKPVRPPKARAQRIATVNRVSVVSFPTTNATAAAGSPANK